MTADLIDEDTDIDDGGFRGAVRSAMVNCLADKSNLTIHRADCKELLDDGCPCRPAIFSYEDLKATTLDEALRLLGEAGWDLDA